MISEFVIYDIYFGSSLHASVAFLTFSNSGS